jgi:adenosine kinase
MSNIILVSGSLAYDRIMNFRGRFKEHIMPEKIHVLSLSFEVQTLEERFGGTAGNIAYNLKLLGEEPKIISAAGEDFSNYRNHLTKYQIDTSFITVIPSKKTAFVNIITDLDDNQISAFHPGALLSAPVLFASDIPQGARLAIVSPEDARVMISRIKEYQKIGLPYIFDPGQQIIKFTGDELKLCSQGAKVLIGNDYEISLICKMTGWTIANILKAVKILVITYGEEGSRIYTCDGEIIIEAVKPIKIVDPTGAGDAYRGGFASGLVRGISLEECGKLASKIATKAIEYYGAQEHWFELTAL